MPPLPRLLPATLLAAALFWPWLLGSQALAFDDPPDRLGHDLAGPLRRVHLSGELAGYYGGPEGAKAWSLSPLVGARFHFTSHWLIESKWGLAQVSLDPDQGDQQSAVRIGNPYVAMHYQGQTAKLSYRVGLGATVPAATLPGDLNERAVAESAYAYAAAMRGNWEFWLWNPHNLSIVVPARLQRRWLSDWIWGVDVAAGVMISLNDKNPDTHAVVQASSDLGYRVNNWLDLGARLSLVVIPKLSAGRSTQLAVEPFARFGNDRAFGTLRLLMNIDNPNGFAFDEHGVWSLRIGGGVAF